MDQRKKWHFVLIKKKKNSEGIANTSQIGPLYTAI